MDYSKVGLKAGLEIHQQLNTGKLFSRTPSLLRSDEPDYTIKRKLHKVAGEDGEIDAAVEHESEVDREFVYQGYNDTISLVELDEEPPSQIDPKALEEAIKIALLLNCEIYPISQIMRKTVIDGSNTSGFQRTVLIGHDGWVETEFGKIGIDSVVLEEDAARIISRNENESVYRLDRLGIPLVEISTKPELRSGEQIKSTALKIGEILRACKVRRGIGTIRQDVNISVSGHERVEIKGFQDPKMMIITVNKEIERQLNEVKQGKVNGEVRNAKSDGSSEFLRPMPGKSRMYPETDLEMLRIGRDLINKVKKELPKTRQEIKNELKKKGLNDEMINLILDDYSLFEEFSLLLNVYDKDANLVAKMVSLWRNEFSVRLKKSFEEIKEILSESVLEKILEKVSGGIILESDVRTVLMNILNGKNIDEALKFEKQSNDSLEEEIRKIILEKPGLRAGGYMGLLITKFGVDLDKKTAMDILNKLL